MAERTLFPQWRQQQDTTRWPFAAHSTLSNGSQLLLEGTFIDAILYPIGGSERLRLSSVVTTHDTVTLIIGDEHDKALATTTFSLLSPPDTLEFLDVHGRPAGLLISESNRLGLFATWGTGTFEFNAKQTEFAAGVCVPTPEVGVRGVLLDDGTLLTGDVWLVGDDGVVVRHDPQAATFGQDPDGSAGTLLALDVIRVDIVGDPLVRRRLCGATDLFITPRFIKTVTFDDGVQQLVVSPDANGDIKMTVNNSASDDTVLRIYPLPEGNKIEAVGSATQNIR